MPVLIQEDWDGAEDSAFLRSSQAAPLLLIQEAHFEWKSSMPSLVPATDMPGCIEDLKVSTKPQKALFRFLGHLFKGRLV